MTLINSEFRHLMQMLEDAADVLESYSDHEEQAQEIRFTVEKMRREHKQEMTYSDELYEEGKGEL